MREQHLLTLLSALKNDLVDAADLSESINKLALLVDLAEDMRREDILCESIQVADVIEKRAIRADACLVRYLRSNAWAALKHIRSTNDNVWEWKQPELVQQMYWLRGAIQHEGFPVLASGRRAQIYCNLGNALSQAGRFVDALVEWRNALREQPIQGMARGNLGIGLAQYGMAVYDEGHTYWLLRSGRDELRRAINGGVGRDGATYLEAIGYFRTQLENIERELSKFEGTHDDAPQEFPLGKTKREQRYRRWCLERNLFLNPLNDIGANSVAADDIMVLPSHRIKGAGITYRAFFNQLKQEYIYARWCLFEGDSVNGVHFADREVLLESNADYAQYSVGLEKMKTGFRCAYSLLDKVAYFVNAYWKVGMSERQVNFRKVWYEEKKGQSVPVGHIRQVFRDLKNLPLRALFFLSEDIFDKSLQDVAEPIAKELDTLRNHLEHKFTKVVIGGLPNSYIDSEVFNDHLSHVVSREELYARTEHLIRVSRSALIYLSLAMHVEERRTPHSPKLIEPFDLGTYPDELKI